MENKSNPKFYIDVLLGVPMLFLGLGTLQFVVQGTSSPAFLLCMCLLIMIAGGGISSCFLMKNEKLKSYTAVFLLVYGIVAYGVLFVSMILRFDMSLSVANVHKAVLFFWGLFFIYGTIGFLMSMLFIYWKKEWDKLLIQLFLLFGFTAYGFLFLENIKDLDLGELFLGAIAINLMRHIFIIQKAKLDVLT